MVDVLPDPEHSAKDLGVLNIAGAPPFSLVPALAPAILALSNDSYRVLSESPAAAPSHGAAAILPIRRVR